MQNVTALKSLFSLPPYAWLLNGTHSTVYADHTGLFAKDDQEHKKEPYIGPTTFNDVQKLMEQFMPAGDWATLDVEVNGGEFALSTIHIVNGSLPAVQLVVAARHRLTKDASAEFKPTIQLTLP